MNVPSRCPTNGGKFGNESGQCSECGQSLDLVGTVGGTAYHHPIPNGGRAVHKAAIDYAIGATITFAIAWMVLYAFFAAAIALTSDRPEWLIWAFVAYLGLPIVVFIFSYVDARFRLIWRVFNGVR